MIRFVLCTILCLAGCAGPGKDGPERRPVEWVVFEDYYYPIKERVGEVLESNPPRQKAIIYYRHASVFPFISEIRSNAELLAMGVERIECWQGGRWVEATRFAFSRTTVYAACGKRGRLSERSADSVRAAIPNGQRG